MKTIQERRKEFLDEMVSYYSEDTTRRSVSEYNGDCMYRNKDGKKCAIGRHIPDELYESRIEHQSLSLGICDLLPLNIRELGFDFLSMVQDLHDDPYFWSETGLSELGEMEYDKIVNSHITESSFV